MEKSMIKVSIKNTTGIKGPVFPLYLNYTNADGKISRTPIVPDETVELELTEKGYADISVFLINHMAVGNITVVIEKDESAKEPDAKTTELDEKSKIKGELVSKIEAQKDKVSSFLEEESTCNDEAERKSLRGKRGAATRELKKLEAKVKELGY